MLRLLLPVLLGLTGLLLGGGAGYFLRPAGVAAPPGESAGAEEPAHEEAAAHGEAETSEGPEYVKLSNQFIVPILDKGKVASMVILSLSLEVTKGSTSEVYAIEPKLRDSFLQVMFDHANAGGFDGAYTDGANLILLRQALLETAKRIMGDTVSDVLIIDIVRQDS